MGSTGSTGAIRTPDQRLRVFVSSTLAELAEERVAVRRAVEQLRMVPVLFELGARPHPPRALYRAYLAQSDVFVGVYWQRYGWVAPGEDVSGLEDEYRLASGLPQLLYVKEPAPQREPSLVELLARVRDDDRVSYRRFRSAEELAALVQDDLALLVSERFHAEGDAGRDDGAAAPPFPLPVPPDETVGRDADLAAVTAALTGGHRLVTLTGAGGIGKTRLALVVAHALRARFPGGVVFVPLSALRDPALLLPTVARHLRIRPEGEHDLVGLVAEGIGGRRTLVVLDNFEHLGPAAGDLAALLARAPSLSVLVTSRHVLRIRGELEHRVPPMAPPAAVELLTGRAGPLLPQHLPADDERAAVEIVELLDGLPLAIELAAARLRVLSPRALLERLRAHLDVLAHGPADLPERQRTLRATMDWSHDLLDPAERALFARLAVFVDGWTLDAVESVCARPGEPDVLDTLTSLLEKSLVVRDEGAGEPRLRMLTTVRAYAEERLGEGPERAEVEGRHRAWMVAFASEALYGVSGRDHLRWAERLDQEWANLRAAMRRALAAGDLGAVALIARDTFPHHTLRDAEAELIVVVDEALGRGPAPGPVRGRLLLTRAMAAAPAGDLALARTLIDEALRLLPDDDDHAVDRALAAGVQALAAGADQPPAESRPKLHDALRRLEALHLELGCAYMEMNLGAVALGAGEAGAAAEHYRLALHIAEGMGNDGLRGQVLTVLGLVEVTLGRADDGRALVLEGARLNRAGGQRSSMAYSVEGLGAVALAAGRADVAARALGAAAASRRRIARPVWVVDAPLIDDVAARARTTLGDAAFGRAEEEGAAWELPDAIDRLLAAVDPAPA